jgi:hypothetical protein
MAFEKTMWLGIAIILSSKLIIILRRLTFLSEF